MFNKPGYEKIKFRKEGLRKKVPFLILDEVWLSQFPKEYKSNKVISLEVKILELMKENARITETSNALSDKKKNALSKILELTTEAYDHNNAKAKAEMEKYQEDVVNINAQLQVLETKAQKLPDEIDTANMELLEETVKICYTLMRDSTDRLETVEQNVEKLRDTLKATVAEKAELKENSAKTYNLLHNLIGPEMIEELDMEYDKKRRKKWF